MRPLLLAVLLASAWKAAGDGFVQVNSMHVARRNHAAVLLADGRVLIAGGHVSELRCEIYDPVTRSFRWTASLSRPRIAATATLLRDGRVLIAGGGYAPDFRGLPFGGFGDAAAEIFDPATETFTPAGPMSAARRAHSATLLADGRVLIAGGEAGLVGGFSYSVHPIATTDVFDPNKLTFATGPTMQTARAWHTATTLATGEILIVGTRGGYDPPFPAADIISADAASLDAGPALAPRIHHTATLLRDGRVLIAGGSDGTAMRYVTAEVFDGSGAGIEVSGLPVGPIHHATALLRDGRVLLTGGTSDFQPVAAAGMFDPLDNQFKTIGHMHQARHGHSATLLQSGDVLIAGGGTESAELFTATVRRRAAGK